MTTHPAPESFGGQIRLNRYLAQCGLGSRRQCDTFIADGKVKVNGVLISELGTRVNPEKDIIVFGTKRVTVGRVHEYIAFHKSKDTVVTASDPEGRQTIYDALRRAGLEGNHLKYVGRLDRNSEGLLLLTNDGDMVHALTHPRFEIKKVYQVRTDKPVSETDCVRMSRDGVMSDGQVLRAGKVRPVSSGHHSRECWCEIDLYEGKNRQIRRMLETLGYNVLRLKRIQFSVIKLGDLPRGAYRELKEREIKALKSVGFGKAKAPLRKG